jgi:hypothetical protein
MALKQINTSYYIKLDIKGNFKIYANQKDRSQEKRNPTYEEISEKYFLIISNFMKDTERRYYDPEFPKLIAD